MKNVAVIGSINIDHVLTVDRLPSLGETISSKDYVLKEGGKGANQAASDAFIGGFVCGLVNDKSLDECICLGNASGSLATTLPGAQESMPTKNQLNKFLSKNNIKINL